MFISVRKLAAGALILLMSDLLAAGIPNREINNLLISRSVPEAYFGMHVRWGATTPYWPQARFHSWRVISTETTWSSLEPQKGVWLFDPLDQAVAVAESRGVEVLYTLGYAPKWAVDRQFIDNWDPGHALPPKKLADWESYVRTVVQRYKGRIKHYELMNEPHFTEVDSRYSKRDFPVAIMVDMARVAASIIKEHDPKATLISMSPSGSLNGIRRLDSFLKAGGGKYIDVVGFHFYEKTPEDIPRLTTALRHVMANYGLAHLPIWNTESGFYISAPNIPPSRMPSTETIFTPTQGGALVSRALTLAVASGIERFYWYSWDIPTMALTEGKGLVISPAGHAYIKTERWLRGATMQGCYTTDHTFWICTLTRGTRQARMVWNTTGVRAFTVPPEWQARQFERLLGDASNVAPNSRIQIDEVPLLIVSDEHGWGST